MVGATLLLGVGVAGGEAVPVDITIRVKEVCFSSVPSSTLLFPMQVELGGVETLTSTSKKMCSHTHLCFHFQIMSNFNEIHNHFFNSGRALVILVIEGL